jgi:bud site selection protein 20
VFLCTRACAPLRSRFFINKATLELHFASKIHKKQAKLVREERYSQLDAELAAGLGRPDNGKPRAAVAVADETKDVSM